MSWRVSSAQQLQQQAPTALAGVGQRGAQSGQRCDALLASFAAVLGMPLLVESR